MNFWPKRFPLFPEAASELATKVDELYFFALLVTVVRRLGHRHRIPNGRPRHRDAPTSEKQSASRGLSHRSLETRRPDSRTL